MQLYVYCIILTSLHCIYSQITDIRHYVFHIVLDRFAFHLLLVGNQTDHQLFKVIDNSCYNSVIVFSSNLSPLDTKHLR